jgi:hypothetical protein
MVALSWALLLPLQCCDTHEEKFKTQFDLEQNKMTMNSKRPWKIKFGGE